MQNMITYPLYDLDMTEFVSFTDPNTCYLYDLFGVVVSTTTISNGNSNSNPSYSMLKTMRKSNAWQT